MPNHDGRLREQAASRSLSQSNVCEAQNTLIALQKGPPHGANVGLVKESSHSNS